MRVDVEDKTWLAELVDRVLRGYDPGSALARLAPELRGGNPDGPSLEARARTLLVRSLHRGELASEREDAFLGPVQGHVELALDIALVHRVPFDPERRRAELACLFAALSGLGDLARSADPGRPGGGQSLAVRTALVRAGAVLKRRGHPPGDPREGLPLRVGTLWIQRRHLARLVISYYASGRLALSGAGKLEEQARSDLVLLVEVLAAISAAAGPPDVHRLRVEARQVGRLGLSRELLRAARAALRSPRSASELARAAPTRLRTFLVEQLLVSELASAETCPERTRFVEEFARESKIPPDQVAALQVDAAELYADQQRWREPRPRNGDWTSEAWEEAADQMMDKVAAAVSDNLEAIVTEIRETGELGELLSKAAAGRALTSDEKARVKEQLVDLAKAVPALAIFAAPGGMLLLPILAKVLPFDLLPSAFRRKAGAPRRKPARTASEKEP